MKKTAKVNVKNNVTPKVKNAKVSVDLLALAIDNISRYGDTDIFPFPIEKHLFFDLKDKVKALLTKLDSDFDNFLQDYPVEQLSTCIPVGIGGFRWATQIDFIWNAYWYYLVLKVSDSIEMKRIPIDKNCIHSYRYDPKSEYPRIFKRDYNWRSFIEESMHLAEQDENKFVVKFDISDFYTRIYHHRLENALTRVSKNTDVNKRIMKILQAITGNASYGLPIGGNASRILAELILNSIDNYLYGRRIKFVRFVDDFVVFARTKEEAFSYLNSVAEFLLKNEGLALQKTKTQILTCGEFFSQSKALIEGDDSKKNSKKAAFMRLHIYFDPYSSNAVEEYECLKLSLSKFDVLKLLKDELKKSRIHLAMGKQLLGAIAHLENDELGMALQTIANNFDAFYPILPSVFNTVFGCLNKCPTEYKDYFIISLTKLVDANSYLIQSENNAAYLIRVLSLSELDEATQAIVKLHSERNSTLVRTNCIYAMTNKRQHYWLSDLKNSFATMSRTERRAFIAASYYLNDEGSHWREKVKRQFTEAEQLMSTWISKKNPNVSNWDLPL